MEFGVLESTRTLFLHREERVETGGYEFNRQEAGGDSGGVKLKQVKSRCEKAKKLLWVRVIDQRQWMNQKMSNYQECESSCVKQNRRMSQPALGLVKGEST